MSHADMTIQTNRMQPAPVPGKTRHTGRIILIAALVVLLGVGGWWAYQSGILAPTSQPAALVAAPVAASAAPVQGTAAETVRQGSAASAVSGATVRIRSG